MNINTKRWVDSNNYKDLMRQVHVDIHIGLKYGVNPEEMKQALSELAEEIKNSVVWEPLKPVEKA
jgi:hypothetical protein